MKELREVRSRYEFQLDNRQVVLLVSGLILTLMLSFLMGALFGSNLNKMKQSPAVAAGGGPAESVAQNEFSPGSFTLPVREAITDEDLAPRSEQAITSSSSSRDDLIRQLESLKVPNEVKEEDPWPEPVKTVAAPAAAVKPEPQPAKPEPATAKPQPASPSPAARTAPPAGTYTIQLASLPKREDAEALVNELRAKRYDAYMLHVSLPDKGSFYRVRIGHYKDLEQARKALVIVQNREGKFFDAWITQ